ncbi:MAG: hypothetical protein KAS32_10150 [Candidatus Peribacteraceae bacterium]|nr:hypothetical protein [Candidatus Peribacteraceae bacterium]
MWGFKIDNVIDIATDMMQVDKLDPSLEERLNYAYKLVKRAGGELVSRQAIACIITAWEYAN